MSIVLWHAECIDLMSTLEPDSLDACVTDPPYALASIAKRYGPGQKPTKHPVYGRITRGFMGSTWDTDIAFRVETWEAVYRVLKPGAHVLAFGSTRTYHRLATAIEDAGFEIRDGCLELHGEVVHGTCHDCDELLGVPGLAWAYGSGFPKSLDVSKAIDKAAGVAREVISRGDPLRRMIPGADQNRTGSWIKDNGREYVPEVTAPATDDARQWDGWGSGLKPAWEPIVVARKPLAGTLAGNVIEYGTGALNIDACRIGYQSEGDRAGAIPQGKATSNAGAGSSRGDGTPRQEFSADNSKGRWPANLVLVHSAGCREVGTRKVRSANGPADYTVTGKQRSVPVMTNVRSGTHFGGPDGTETIPEWKCTEDCPVRLLDELSGELHSQRPETRISRSKAAGVTSMGTGRSVEYGDRGGASRFFYTAKASRGERSEGLGARNGHPTVKPTDLMAWMIRLVVPPGGTVLDPFLGSGSTAVAVQGLGADYSCIGVERDAEWFETARGRVGMFAELHELPEKYGPAY